MLEFRLMQGWKVAVNFEIVGDFTGFILIISQVGFRVSSIPVHSPLYNKPSSSIPTRHT